MPAESRENPLLKKGNSDAFFKEKYLTKNTLFNSQPRALGNQLLCALYTKLARRELNTDIWSQSPLRYHYVTGQYFSDPSGNTIRTIMLPPGTSKEKK